MSTEPAYFPALESIQASTHFEEFLRSFDPSQSLLHEEHLSKLSLPGNEGGLRLCLDGSHLLVKALRALHLHDRFWFLVTPAPPQLFGMVRRTIMELQNRGIEPILVFHGLSTHGDVESFINTQEELSLRDGVWDALRMANPTQREDMVSSEDLDAAFDVVLGEDVEMSVIRYLQLELKVEVYRAPYLAWAQMAAFQSKSMGYCDELCGPAELLLFEGVERVITEINFERETFNYFLKSECCERMFARVQNPVKQRQAFLDLGLLSATHPQLVLLRMGFQPTVHDAFILVQKWYESGTPTSMFIRSLYTARTDADQQYRKYMKGRAFILHNHILTSNCDAVSISSYLQQNATPNRFSPSDNFARSVPKNMHLVLGSKLPPIFYFLAFIGVLPPSTLVTLSQNYIRDDNPVCDSKEYRKIMELVLSLRAQTMCQLSEYLAENAEYKKRVKVQWIRWFDPVCLPVVKPPDIKLDSWLLDDVTPDTFASKPISFVSVLQYANRAVGHNVEYSNVHQILCAAYLKGMDLLGYFTHGPHPQYGQPPISGCSVYALALQNAFDGPSRQHAEFALMVLELIRTSSLNTREWVMVTGGNFTILDRVHWNRPGSRTEQALLFLRRLLSIVHVPVDSAPWGGPLERDLATFLVLARGLQRTLRNLLECMLASLFLDGTRINFDLSLVAEVAHHLPFGRPFSAVGGLIVKHITTDDGYLACSLPSERWNHLRATFPNVANLEHAIRSIYRNWDIARRAITSLIGEDTQHQYCMDTETLRVASSIMQIHENALFGPETPTMVHRHDYDRFLRSPAPHLGGRNSSEVLGDGACI